MKLAQKFGQLAARHLAERAAGEALFGKDLRDGDVIRLCAHEGKLEVLADLSAREPAMPPQAAAGMGRGIFAMFRTMADGAEAGGSAMLASGGL